MCLTVTLGHLFAAMSAKSCDVFISALPDITSEDTERFVHPPFPSTGPLPCDVVYVMMPCNHRISNGELKFVKFGYFPEKR